MPNNLITIRNAELRVVDMSQIILESSSTVQWQKLVHEAESICDLHLDEELESYLVFLLMRFLDRSDFTSRIMAMDYLHSLVQSGQSRQESLRDVGDHCLLFSGLFPKIAERRRVKVSYYVGIGISAYNNLADSCREKLGDLYRQLADAFVQLMDILQAIASMRDNKEILSPLQALELWGDTQSKQALRCLKNNTDGFPVINTSNFKH